LFMLIQIVDLHSAHWTVRHIAHLPIVYVACSASVLADESFKQLVFFPALALRKHRAGALLVPLGEKREIRLMEQFDLVIVGAGSAAMAAATKAAELGKTAAVIERGTVGGTCVNVGCVPSKHLLRAGEIFYYGQHNNFGSITGGEGLRLDFAKAVEDKRRLVKSLRQNKYEQVLSSLPGVSHISGTAVFTGPNEIIVDGRPINGDKFLIAAGSSPFIPPIAGIDRIDYLTNVEALELDELPESMIVLGGGPLGLEFAQMYAHFGTRVYVVQKAPRLLPRAEPEIAEALHRYLEEEGIEICVNADARAVRVEGQEKVLTVKVGDETREYRGERLLVATGRAANTKGLGLEAVGIELGKRGEIIVDDEQRTSVPHIYAAGDIVGEPMLETTAAREGTIAAENAMSGSDRKMDYSAVPMCIFTYPQAAQVGMTDAEATGKGYTCACRVLDLSQVPKAQVIKDTRGVIKMTADAETGRILGVSILAPEAGDLIQEATLAIKFKLAIYDLIDTVHVFPTLSESLKLVAQAYVKDVTKMPCCTD
jgi:mercuric reductase